MHLRIYDPTILAIDLRHRRFGYAVFEGHRALLDCGVRVYPSHGDLEAAMASKRLDALLGLFHPSVIVVKKERWESAQTSSHMRNLVEAFAREAFAHSIQIHLIGQAEIEATFHMFDCKTRDEIASVLVRIFPELAWDLPSKRKLWQAQHPRMTIFDAIALGLAYWQHGDTRPSPPPGTLKRE